MLPIRGFVSQSGCLLMMCCQSSHKGELPVYVQVPGAHSNQDSTGSSDGGVKERRQGEQQDTANIQTHAAAVLSQQQQHNPSGSSTEPLPSLQPAIQDQLYPDQRVALQEQHRNGSHPTSAAADTKRLQEPPAAGGAQVQADSTTAQQTAPPPEAQEASAADSAFTELSPKQKQDPEAASGRLQATGAWTACLHTVRPCLSLHLSHHLPSGSCPASLKCMLSQAVCVY